MLDGQPFIDWSALVVSLELAFASSILLLLLAIPIARWLAFTRSRVRAVVESFVMLPFVLPPTVIGFYLLIALAPVQIAFSFTALLIGTVLINLPIAVQAFTEVFRSIHRDLVEAAVSLGATPFQVFFKLILPASLTGIVSGLALCFAHALGEFGVAMMVGGNIRGETRTLSISVYDSVQTLDMVLAHRTAAAQLVLGFAFLFVINYFKRKEI